MQAHHQRLIGDDEIARMASAKAWAVWEARTSSLLPKQSLVDFFGSPHTALSLARIESHYFVNDSFLEPDQILVHSHRLKNIPGIIVHGRYDMVCPIENAWALNQAWSESLLEIIPDAGHSATEPSIINALIRATIDMAVTLREMGR